MWPPSRPNLSKTDRHSTPKPLNPHTTNNRKTALHFFLASFFSLFCTYVWNDYPIALYHAIPIIIIMTALWAGFIWWQAKNKLTLFLSLSAQLNHILVITSSIALQQYSHAYITKNSYFIVHGFYGCIQKKKKCVDFVGYYDHIRLHACQWRKKLTKAVIV